MDWGWDMKQMSDSKYYYTVDSWRLQNKAKKGCFTLNIYFHLYLILKFISVCPQTSFGWDCSLRCPITCKDGMCNSKTGVCDRCILGFSGPTCDKSDTESKCCI